MESNDTLSDIFAKLRITDEYKNQSDYYIKKNIASKYNITSTVKKADLINELNSLNSTERGRSKDQDNITNNKPKRQSSPKRYIQPYVEEFNLLLSKLPKKSQKLEILLNIILVVTGARFAYRLDQEISKSALITILDHFKQLTIVTWHLESEPIICLAKNKSKVERLLKLSHLGMAKLLGYCYHGFDWNQNIDRVAVRLVALNAVSKIRLFTTMVPKYAYDATTECFTMQRELFDKILEPLGYNVIIETRADPARILY